MALPVRFTRTCRVVAPILAATILGSCAIASPEMGNALKAAGPPALDTLGFPHAQVGKTYRFAFPLLVNISKNTLRVTSWHLDKVPKGAKVDAFQWVALAVVWAVTVLPGMAAIFCGWLLPWMRSRIASPRLYGGGQVMVGLGITIGMPTSHWHSPASLAGPIVGFLLIFCGVGLGMSSTRRPDQGHEDENRRGWGRSAPRL
jgi:uncharacterized membrane protein